MQMFSPDIIKASRFPSGWLTVLSSAAPLNRSLPFRSSHSKDIANKLHRPRGRLQRMVMRRNNQLHVIPVFNPPSELHP